MNMNMGLFVCSLNSGSNGNCYYVGNDEESVLIDAGLSCRETEKRMKHTGLDISKVKAVFISHEHTDHINGLTALSEKYRLAVYANRKTARHFPAVKVAGLLRELRAGDTAEIGRLRVSSFSKNHDADDPVSFTVSQEGVHVGVYTDIGKPCSRLISHFKNCHAAFLEANYDEEMLMNGNYPHYLKKRISGDQGHLSNSMALELFRNYRPDHMSHLFLSHLSKENNCPDKARQLFEATAGTTHIIVASRFEPTLVYEISGSHNPEALRPRPEQMKLF